MVAPRVRTGPASLCRGVALSPSIGVWGNTGQGDSRRRGTPFWEEEGCGDAGQGRLVPGAPGLTADALWKLRGVGGWDRFWGPESCSTNEDKLSNSGENQDFERRESPRKSPRAPGHVLLGEIIKKTCPISHGDINHPLPLRADPHRPAPNSSQLSL